MHRIFIGLVVVGISSVAHAQAENYNPIRVDSALSGTYVSASGRGGFGAVVEPKFAVHDQISVGLRLEGAVMFGGNIGNDGNTSMDMGAAASMMAKGEYLFTTTDVRPFVGLGLGMIDIASQSISTSTMSASIDQKAGRYFAVAPQIGIDLGRLRLAATYNVIMGADIEVHQMIGGIDQKASFSQNYLTFELGIRFGGGRIAKPIPAGQITSPPSATP